MRNKPVLLYMVALLGVGFFFMGYRIWYVVRPDIKLVLENGVDQNYHGKYASDRRYLEFLRKAGAMRWEALTAVQQRLDINLEARTKRIVVRFVDLEGNHGRQTGALGKEGLCRIAEINVESLWDADSDPEKVLRHELTHAVMKESMSWRFTWLPHWFVEGSAVWVAGQVDDKMATYVESALSEGKNPMALINGLDTKPHQPEDYIEDGLFFTYLERTFGVETIQRIIHRILRREPYQEAFEQETRLKWGELQRQGKAYALEAIQAYLSREHLGKQSLHGVADPLHTTP